MSHDSLISARRQHARRDRSIGKVEVGLSGQLLVTERQLEVARFDVEGLRDANVHIRVYPGGLLAQTGRLLEVFAQLTGQIVCYLPVHSAYGSASSLLHLVQRYVFIGDKCGREPKA